MRAFVCVAVAAAGAPRPLSEDVTGFDLACFDSKCGSSTKACIATDKNCADRIACMTSKGAAGAGSCFDGLTVAGMTKAEQAVLACATLNSCLQMAPASLIQLKGDDDSDKPDYDGLQSAEEKLKAFTKRTEGKVAHLEEKKQEYERKLGGLPDDDSSLLEKQSVEVGADGSTKAADPATVDPVEHLLSGIEGMIAKLQGEESGEPSLLQVSKNMPPVDKLEHLDDATMVLVLGALTSSMGLDHEAGSFLQSGDSSGDSAVQKAYQMGMMMGRNPDFLSDFMGHPGYLPEGVIDAMGLKRAAPATDDYPVHGEDAEHEEEAEKDLREHD